MAMVKEVIADFKVGINYILSVVSAHQLDRSIDISSLRIDNCYSTNVVRKKVSCFK